MEDNINDLGIEIGIDERKQIKQGRLRLDPIFESIKIKGLLFPIGNGHIIKDDFSDEDNQVILQKLEDLVMLEDIEYDTPDLYYAVLKSVGKGLPPRIINNMMTEEEAYRIYGDQVIYLAPTKIEDKNDSK